MPENHDSQLLKGVLPMLVLAVLRRGESYGYELVVQLQAAGLPDLAAGTVYPVLTRLEREGEITSRLVPSRSGPARKYYTPTASGLRTLAGSARAWHALTATVEPLLADTERPEEER
jgi:PadR family transcriptional regulator PadR